MSTEYIISWKSNGVHHSKLIALLSTFLFNIKYFEYKTGMQFDNTPLVVERNNYKMKIVNVYIVYDLDYCPKNSLRNFSLKYCLFGTTNTEKIMIKISMCIVTME